MSPGVVSLGSVCLVPPPSANRYWRNFRGQTVRSKEATEWMKYAVEEVKSNIRPTDGQVWLKVNLHLGKGVMETADLGNFLKVAEDVLTHAKYHKEKPLQLKKPGAGIIVDDNVRYVRRIELEVHDEVRVKKSIRSEARLEIEVIAL